MMEGEGRWRWYEIELWGVKADRWMWLALSSEVSLLAGEARQEVSCTCGGIGLIDMRHVAGALK